MDVYCVRFVQLSTGTRIEFFNIQAILFSNREQAIAYAKNLVQTHGEDGGISFEASDEDDDTSEDGSYNDYTCLVDYRYASEYYYTSAKSSGGYDQWPDLEVAVTKEILDLKNGFEITFDA